MPFGPGGPRMRGPITDFWGKLDREAGTWHPLVDHCADVAAYFEALMDCSSARLRLEVLAARPLAQVDFARLCVLATLHDIGKFNHGFQRKADPMSCDVAGHVNEVMEPLRVGGRVAGLLIDALGDVVAWEPTGTLLGASICHHGSPAKRGRQHLHETIDGRGLPVRHQTRREGRPHTLVLTKTDEVFTRDHEKRTRWRAARALLGPKG